MPEQRSQIPWLRLILTALILAFLGWLDLGVATGSTLLAGKMAGAQFDASDASYVETAAVFQAVRSASGIANFIAFLLLLVVWIGPVLAWFGALALAALLLTAQPQGAWAYYNQSDYAEPFFILPNESAFFIPDVGDNKSSQASFGSEQYLAENKIAAKRFTIPHSKLPNSGLWSNYYVPAGRLIIVDRTPYSREWVASDKRGSSAKDDGVHCQTSEGLDYTVGLAIGVSVYEENAAKFLFRFGVKPPAGDRTQPDVIFTSVFYGRSLVEVMDGPARNKVQALVCGQISAHTLDEDNAEATQIIASVDKDVRAYLADVGITLDYIGWADTATFDPKVQGAINRRYEAARDAEIAKLLAPYSSTIQSLALAEALRDKWNGALPTSVSLWSLPAALSEMVSGGAGKAPDGNR